MHSANSPTRIGPACLSSCGTQCRASIEPGGKFIESHAGEQFSIDSRDGAPSTGGMKQKYRFPTPGTPPATLMKRVSGDGEPPQFRVVEYSPTFFEEKKYGHVS